MLVVVAPMPRSCSAIATDRRRVLAHRAGLRGGNFLRPAGPRRHQRVRIVRIRWRPVPIIGVDLWSDEEGFARRPRKQTRHPAARHHQVLPKCTAGIISEDEIDGALADEPRIFQQGRTYSICHMKAQRSR